MISCQNLLLRFAAFTLLSASLPAADGLPSRWQFEAAASFWSGVRINHGAEPGSFPSSAPKTDRFYVDGYNRVDASGNLGDGVATGLASRTGYFGFTSDSQVDLKAGTLSLHSLGFAEGFLARTTPATRPGVALTVRRDLAAEASTRRWGVELGADWQTLRDSRSGTWTENVRVLTDSYQLGGVVPQRAPYQGRFSPLPGDQRIGDVPSRNLTTTAGTTVGTRETTVRLSLLHVGPWLNLRPEQSKATPGEGEWGRWSVDARLALALLHFDGRLAFNEEVRTPGVGAALVSAGEAKRRRWDLGVMAGARVRRRCSERWSLVGAADFLVGSNFTLATPSRFSRVEAGRIMRFTLGLDYRLDRR